MRLPFTAALIACAMSAVPHAGQAQEGAAAAAAPAPSAGARQALWCGAAFTILSSGTDLAAVAADYKAKAGAAFGNAAAELIPEGMTVDQFKALAEQIAADVTAPFREESYTREECEAAATTQAEPTAPTEPSAAVSGGDGAPIPAEPPAQQ